MILAAGEGTRLHPLTLETPKALVEVAGEPMLERVARRLVEAGADRLIVNVHWMAEQVEAFLREKEGWGAEIRISREGEERLETGGGLRHAEEHFRKDAPFFLHNVDVISRIDLEVLYARHLEERPLATLAVSERESSRPLLVDREGVYGHRDREGRESRAREPVGEERSEVGFSGIHVVEPEIFSLFTEEGRFSIIATYMRLIGEGRRVATWDIGDALWIDVGTHERLEEARAALAE